MSDKLYSDPIYRATTLHRLPEVAGQLIIDFLEAMS